MTNIKVHYSCVVDNDPKFLLQAHIFVHSLLALGVEAKSIFINLVFKDALQEKRFSDIGVNVSTYNKFGDRKYCNKLVQFENKALLDCDYIFLCDCDIGFVKSVQRLAEENFDKIIGKAVDAANPPLAMLQSIFHFYDKEIGQVIDVHGGRSSTFNINGGFIGIPASLFEAFGERWQYFALQMLSNSKLLSEFESFNKHVDQISFSLAASEFGQFTNIDARFNFPVHSPAFIEQNKSFANDIHCIHYHDSFTQIGLIAAVNNTHVNSSINKLNCIISKQFDNQLFWNFRYKYFPELGSGQGSRGEVREQKRQLLCELGLTQYKSVLDIGCGDGEMLSGIDINNYIGVDISEAAIKQHKIKRAKGKFILAESAISLPSGIAAELTLCFEVLIHQTSIEDFDATLSRVISATTKRLVISGYENIDSLDKSHMCFFHRPLKESLIASGKFKSVKKVANYHNLVVYVADVNPEVASDKTLRGEPSTLICTGFHRSGTSAIANYLKDAGLNLGDDLMAGGISNAKGHFEDWPAVKLHDAQLVKSNTSWQFHDECELSAEPDFLYDYIAQRSENTPYWGVKDPRACLFLNEWQHSLGDKGAFVFVARHWGSCVESLLHRHSRELAYGLTEVNLKSVDVSFWAQPTLAAKMWLSYTKRLVAFAKKYPEKTIVITQRALFEGAPVLQAINSKFGFQLEENTTPPFDVSLFRDKANKRIFSELSTAFQVQLNSVWQELLAVATFKTDNEMPVIVEQKVDQQALDNIYQQISKLPNDSFSGNALVDDTLKQSNNTENAWYEKLLTISELAVMIQYLDGTTAEQVQNIESTKWLTYVNDNFVTQGNVFLSVAKLLMKVNEPELAICYFQKTISLGVYFPFVDAMLGQCYQALNAYKESGFHFKKAIQNNPKQAMFYIHYAKLLTALKQLQKAKEQFTLGYEKGRKQPAIVIAYCNFLADNNELSKAIDIAEAFISENQHPGLVNLLTRMKLKQNVVIGQDYYIERVTEKLKHKDPYAWLAKTCLLIDSATAEKDFITRCLGHWYKVL